MDNIIKDCWVTWVKLGHSGLVMYLCYHSENISPIGFVWGLSIGNQKKEGIFHVLGSYELKHYRRKNVRTLINKTIMKHNKIIQSWFGTNTGGKAFMKASGYTYDKIRNDWYLVRRNKRGKR